MIRHIHVGIMVPVDPGHIGSQNKTDYDPKSRSGHPLLPSNATPIPLPIPVRRP